MSGAIIAAALTDTSAQPFSLFINSLNLLRTTQPARSFGVPLESIHITESGINVNGSMDFELQDPGKELSLAGGERVFMYERSLDDPLFLGVVEDISQSSWSATGRTWKVRCVDDNIVLDRALIDSLTLAANVAGRQAWI